MTAWMLIQIILELQSRAVHFDLTNFKLLHGPQTPDPISQLPSPPLHINGEKTLARASSLVYVLTCKLLRVKPSLG